MTGQGLKPRIHYSYDAKCEELALTFLSDAASEVKKPFTKQDLQELSQDIQDNIELWLCGWKL